MLLAYLPGVFKVARGKYNYLHMRYTLCYMHLLAMVTLLLTEPACAV